MKNAQSNREKSVPGAPKRKRKSSTAKLSRTTKPAELSLHEWQAKLRQQFGREQKFTLKNLGSEPIFSEFSVFNPQSGSVNRVTVRGAKPGDNACTCMDFAINALGTCKHIEFTLGKLERKPGAKAALNEGHHPAYSHVSLRYGAKRQIQFVPGTQVKEKLRPLMAQYCDFNGVFRSDRYDKFEHFIKQAGTHDPSLKCDPDALAFVAEARDAKDRIKRIDAAFPKGIDDPGFKKLVTVDLYPYQRQGALFAAKAGRCLIGDEMGLGKTIQAIAGAEIMAHHLGVQRALIICPTSLKHQWEREIQKFTGRPATVINGLRKTRTERFAEPGFFKITNYDTLHTDLDLITQWSPDLVILDEAQRIKNWSTRAARTVKRIKSPYAIVLTGTPLENRLQELVSIVEFVDAHRLGPTFKFLADHQLLDTDGKVVGYRSLDTIGKSLEPILLRRLKSQVLTQLPPRLDKNFFVQMGPIQRKHHAENQEAVALLVAKWRRMKFLSESDQRKLMISLQNMRMSCDSSYLLDDKTNDGVKPDELAVLLDELLETPGVKVVVFSQWLKMHQLIVRKLEERKIGHVLFHGGVPSAQRKDLIDTFRIDPNCRVFLSTDAGGVGLNLQFASVVVNMDLPWNPAVLEQRIGRVHRMGQSRPVQVVNFVSQGTIEEGMLSVLKFKKSLFTGALDGGETEVFLGGSKLKRFIESVETATTGIPTAEPAEPAPEPEDFAEPQSNEPRTRAAESTPAAAAVPDTTASPQTTAGPEPTPPLACTPEDAWGQLLQTGLSMLAGLAAPSPDASGDSKPASIVRTDPGTGQPYLHLPMPKPETLQRFMALAGELLAKLQPPSSPKA
jgi:superfamily II DNA or RNA helicase